jgi:hypothetical protein
MLFLGDAVAESFGVPSTTGMPGLSCRHSTRVVRWAPATSDEANIAQMRTAIAVTAANEAFLIAVIPYGSALGDLIF